MHGSKRSIDCLKDDGTGNIRCIEGRECRVVSYTTQINCSFWQRGTCNRGGSCVFAHNDNANAQEQSWASAGVDIKGKSCAYAGSPQPRYAPRPAPLRPPPLTGDRFGICSLHSSGRSLNCLADDGTGNLRCIEGRECRVRSFQINRTASVGRRTAHSAHCWHPKLPGR